MPLKETDARGVVRPDVVLLSGLLCDDTVWDEQQRSMSDLARIHTKSFFGWNSIGDMARSVLETSPERFVLVGHSMGGRVALEVVSRAPERVQALGLLNTGIHTVRPGEREKRAALVELAHREGMAVLAGQWLPPMLTAESLADARLTSRLVQMVCRCTPEIFARQIEALLNRPDPTAYLDKIECPTLLASGSLDTWSPYSQHREIADKIPGSELFEIEGAGHMSIVERPEAVTSMLAGWLASMDRKLLSNNTWRS